MICSEWWAKACIAVLYCNARAAPLPILQESNASPRQRRDDLSDIVPHHGDIGRRLAACLGERVGIELAADVRASLLGDHLHEPGIDHVLQEKRRHLLSPDLANDI